MSSEPGADGAVAVTAVSMESGAARWSWLSRRLGPVARQVIPLIVATAIVQVLLPFRSDNAAHVLGGGALVMFVGATAPRRWLLWLGAAAEAAMLAFVLIVAHLTEWTLLGPFDVVDVAFTMGGAFLALAALPSWSAEAREQRGRLASAALLLGAASLVLRYLLGIGAA